MQLNKLTTDILKNFSTINPNLVIKVGNNISTISPANDVYASFNGEDEFDEQMSIFNLNEFLGVLSAFDKPELDLETKYLTIKEGKQKVKYNYAEESMLHTPPDKGIKFPGADISLDLTEEVLAKLQKMAAILSAADLAVIGDGEKVTLKIFDKNNSSCNELVIDTEVETDKEFQLNFKIAKLRMIPGDYSVEISKKLLAKFKHTTVDLFYYVAVEVDSVVK